MNEKQKEAIEAVSKFRNDLENVLSKHLMSPELPAGVVLYKDADFKNFDNLTEDQKAKYFIPLYHGVLYLGFVDHRNLFKDSTGHVPLSKYL